MVVSVTCNDAQEVAAGMGHAMHSLGNAAASRDGAMRTVQGALQKCCGAIPATMGRWILQIGVH